MVIKETCMEVTGITSLLHLTHEISVLECVALLMVDIRKQRMHCPMHFSFQKWENAVKVLAWCVLTIQNEPCQFALNFQILSCQRFILVFSDYLKFSIVKVNKP